MSWTALVKPSAPSPQTTSSKFQPKVVNEHYRPDTVVGIDFETYYGKNYTLRKLTTTNYVRGLSRAEIHGASISINGEEAHWHRAEDLEMVFNSIDWSRSAMLAHNCAFDGFILSQHYGHIANYYFDTMSMARGLLSHDIPAGLDSVARHYGLGSKIAGALEGVINKRWHEFSEEQKLDMELYCNNDVQIMWKIFEKMLPDYPHDELDLIDASIKAFARPLIEVDATLVVDERRREEIEKAALIKRVADRYQLPTESVRKRLSSNPQFAELLVAEGIEPPMKPSPSNPEEMTYAFAKNDIAFQDLGTHPDEHIRDLIEARRAVKSTIGESRAGRVLEHSDLGKKPIPIMLNYCKAHTMRWTGGDKINPQNFPSNRTNSKLRHTLIAPKGMAMVVIDSSQIEDRMNAYTAGQNDVLEAYRSGIDNYKLMASRIYDVKIDDVTKQQRFVGKVARLGLGYQCGVAKFTYMLRSGAMGPPVYESDLSDAEIASAHTKYRRASDKVVSQWYNMNDQIVNMRYGNENILYSGFNNSPLAKVVKDGILMPNGLKLHYPGITTDPDGQTTYQASYNMRSKLYGGLLTENYVQCLARIVVGEQMLKIASEFPVVMMTHDEVVYLTPVNDAQAAYDYGLECMKWVPDWCPGLPVDADGDFGDNYGEIK
jgi:hypothetical protein